MKAYLVFETNGDGDAYYQENFVDGFTDLEKAEQFALQQWQAKHNDFKNETRFLFGMTTDHPYLFITDDEPEPNDLRLTCCVEGFVGYVIREVTIH